jgi:hypothetical protein
MDRALEHLLSTAVQMRTEEERAEKEEDVIKVSETVAVAASAYETVRNALEYDEEHLLRRNAIRRILKRDMIDGPDKNFAGKLIKELIWAKYLPNERVPTAMTPKVENILEKYTLMFGTLEAESEEGKRVYEWLLDVLSVEIEYMVSPPCIDEALASYAYQELKKRVEWKTKTVAEEDRDLQLYIAIHRSVLKSNRATLRYRIFTLYYNKWRKAKAGDAVVKEIAMNLSKVIDAVETQITHPAQDATFRFVRRHAIVFHTLADIIKDNPEAFSSALHAGDIETIDTAISKAAQERYGKFRTKLGRTVIRACAFLLITKTALVMAVEVPFELLILKANDFLPLVVNVLFPPVLLALIGLSVRIPKKANNEKILEELHAILGVGDDMQLIFKYKGGWTGPLAWIFNGFYAVILLLTIVVISSILKGFHFNPLSTFFFIFFLSLVAYFGLRIRNTRRELLVIDISKGLISSLVDVFFLPLIRAGRWMSIRAPKVNVFLFFFDFIIEAPFKAAFNIFESWLAFLREKREEI